MTTTRKEYRYALWEMARIAIVAVPGVLAFTVIWRRFFLLDVYFWLAVAAFAVCVAGTFAVNLVRWKFTCPECGGRIRDRMPHEIDEDDDVRFYCEPCDIIWDTGITYNVTGCD